MVEVVEGNFIRIEIVKTIHFKQTYLVREAQLHVRDLE